MPSWIEGRNNGIVVFVYTQPGASRTEITGIWNTEGETRLKVRVQAPPVDGKANQALLEFLSNKLGISKSKLSLTRGETSRKKDVFCAGLNLQTAQEKLTPYEPPS